LAGLPFTDTHVHFHDLREPSLTYAWLRPEDPSDSPDDLGPFGAIKSERYPDGISIEILQAPPGGPNLDAGPA